MKSTKRTIFIASECATRRRILIAGMGTSPAVLTETVWALAHQENELMYANYGLSCSGLLRNRKVAQTLRPRFHSSCRFDILLPVMLRQSFTDFIFATNTDGSGKTVSYVRALDMLGPILTRHHPKPFFSLADIHAFSRSGTRQLRAVTFMKDQASKEQMTWEVLRVDLCGNYYCLELGKRIA